MNFTIRAENVDQLQKLLNDSNKKATKLGVPCATMQIVGHGQQEILRKGKPTGAFRRMAIVEVTGGIPKLNGWELIGLLHHIASDEAGKDLTVQHTIPNKTIPVLYKNGSNVCEHCNTLRRRNTTFILANTDGRFTQVGSSCLADFLGFNADPMALARYAEQYTMFEAAIREIDEREEVVTIKGKTSFYNTRHFLSYVAAAIRTHGWLSKGKAMTVRGYMVEKATATVAFGKMLADMNPEFMADTDYLKYVAAVVVTDADTVEANRVADYMSVYFDSQDEASLGDYLSNLRLALFQSSIPGKLVGIVASVFAAYNRIQSDAARIEAARKEMAANPVAPKLAHVGQLNVRMAFQARVITIKNLENSVLVKLEDVDGNKLTWFATDFPHLEVGRIYELVGTPKAHEEYRGLKSTIINRVVVSV